VLFGRRRLLLSTLAMLTAGCSRVPTARPQVPSAVLPADFDRWHQEAQGILSDGLQTLRTFDDFQAFRFSSAANASGGLTWDPPTGAAWDEATHVTRGLHGRAEQLFRAVTTATLDPTVWREQRALADATHNLLDLGDALGGYRDRVDVLPPGDAAGGLELLDAAWSQWDAAAARWSISRWEPIQCGR
jgi:hypothetical protein